MKNILVSEPYALSSAPWGRVIESLNRKVWSVSKQSNTKTIYLGSVVKFNDQPNRYVIHQLYPMKDFRTLKGAVNFLARNEGKLCFCS